MTRFMLALALLTTNCAYYEDRALPVAQPEQITASVSYTIHGDTECLPPIRAAVEQRGRQWGSVSRGHISYRFTWDLTPSAILQYRDAPQLLCWPRVVDNVTGREICGTTVDTIVILSTAPHCDTSAVALHELGHLAGIGESKDPLAVMHPDSLVTRLTASDVRACAAVGLCPHPGRPRDVTTVTLTIDPDVPRVEPEYPR